MRRIVLGLSLFLVFGVVAAFAVERVEAPAECGVCGMDRTMFAQSRMRITYADGSSAGTCSIHCAAENLQKNPGKKIGSLQVADYGTRLLIDAKRATWVIGGAKSGVMTALPKWAFAKKEDAQAFVKTNGGRLARFDQALVLATKE